MLEYHGFTETACFATVRVTQRNTYRSLANLKPRRLVYAEERRELNLDRIEKSVRRYRRP